MITISHFRGRNIVFEWINGRFVALSVTPPNPLYPLRTDRAKHWTSKLD